jgi:hypothetical protein
MGLIAKRKTATERAILRHQEANAQFLNIGISHEQIVDKINAFDWLDMAEAKTEDEMAVICLKFFKSFNFKYPKDFETIIVKAFAHKFKEAQKYLADAIIEVSHSYNVEGSSRGFQHDTVNKFYYINYWADKKNIPVNYNEKDQEKRALFNLDTIILSILADKLHTFNEFERNKPKK